MYPTEPTLKQQSKDLWNLLSLAERATEKPTQFSLC